MGVHGIDVNWPLVSTRSLSLGPIVQIDSWSRFLRARGYTAMLPLASSTIRSMLLVAPPHLRVLALIRLSVLNQGLPVGSSARIDRACKNLESCAVGIPTYSCTNAGLTAMLDM